MCRVSSVQLHEQACRTALFWLSTCLQLLPLALQAPPTAPLSARAAAAAPTVAPSSAATAALTATAAAAAAASAAPLDASAAAALAAAGAAAEAAAPQPAQPTPAVRMEAAHKQLKSYLPGELCEAFRETGLKYDLYDWQVRANQCAH